MKTIIPPARQDRRPLYYDVGQQDQMQCITCLKNGITVLHDHGRVFMNDPANSPERDGAVYTICIGHIPDDAVIFNPFSKKLRNKSGDQTWTE